jgi:ATP-dependent DNA helicase RecG
MDNLYKNISLDIPLYEVLGPKFIFLKKLKKLEIETVHDILWHFPVRYEDFSNIYKIADLEPGQEATIRAELESVKIKRTWTRGIGFTEAVIFDETGSIRAVWFNQTYIASSLKTGKIMNFSGKVSQTKEGELYFANPLFEAKEEGEETTHTGKLISIYGETKGLTSRGIRFIVNSILKKNPNLEEWMPEQIIEKYNFPNLKNAIKNIHSPKNIEDALKAKDRFSFEDLFLLQLSNLRQKMKLNNYKAPEIPIDIERIKDILSEIPFALTQSQKQSLWEIVQDMNKTKPMNRLLQGDVGSGKTIVAAIAAIMSAEHNFQTAIMAPTEILARQHFETMKKLCAKISKEIQPTIGLITSSEAFIFFENDIQAKISKKEFNEKISNGKILIVIGTHALIQKSVKFKKLGLVIIDEQHRFGVKQRQSLLREKNIEEPAQSILQKNSEKRPKKTISNENNSALTPHFLSMSATPIPRTLMLTIFGDLDISLITELPNGRKPIKTRIVPPTDREKVYQFIRSEIKNGRQTFVICPRIEEKEEDNSSFQKNYWFNRDDLKSVKAEYEKLSKNIFPDLKVAMIHGKMKAKEKEKIMEEFRKNKINILVSTSVIEVGVDIPNASIMTIEGADSFGLAQLYQFRGRVGRGEYQSYCFLMTETASGMNKARLKAIETAKNGFQLAEEDMKLRGPGEFLGEAQSGFSDTIINALKNPETIKETREAAINIIQNDPLLLRAPILKQKLAGFEKNLHKE